MTHRSIDAPLWTPTQSRIASSRMTTFWQHAEQLAGTTFAAYSDLHAWSAAQPDEFWPVVWDFCGIIGERGERVLVEGDRMLGAKWFPEARLNFAENLLRR